MEITCIRLNRLPLPTLLGRTLYIFVPRRADRAALAPLAFDMIMMI